MTDAEKIIALRAALGPYLSSGHWGSIGAIDNTRLLQISREHHEFASGVFAATDPQGIQSVIIHYPGHEVTQTIADGRVITETSVPVPGYSPTPAFNEDGSMVHPPSPQGEFFVPAAQSAAEEDDKRRLREKEINRR